MPRFFPIICAAELPTASLEHGACVAVGRAARAALGRRGIVAFAHRSASAWRRLICGLHAEHVTLGGKLHAPDMGGLASRELREVARSIQSANGALRARTLSL